MQKICKKVLSCLLVFALCLSLVPVSDGIGLEKKVAAATDPSAYADSKKLDTTIIQDVKLLNALKRIIGNDNLTFGELKAYDGVIDLSNDTEIGSVKGLGYALNASKIDLSKLTKVKKIEKDEFKSCSFSQFLLPPTVTEIDAGAFCFCSNLQTIQFPSTLTIIENQAFDGCTKLDNITLPTNIARIGSSAFESCKALTSIVIPDGINASSENSSDNAENGIGANVFNGCESLSSITIGAGMTAIPVGFLQGTKALESITVPKAIMAIRENAFYGSALRSIDLSQNTKLTKISKGAFASCKFMRSIQLPISIEIIEDNGFSNCSGITNPTFLSSLSNLKEIGSYAFQDLGVKSLVIPGNVEKIGNGAFYESAVESVELKDYLSSSNNNRCKSIGNLAFKDCIQLKSFTFPTVYENDERTSIVIGANAFENCVQIDNIRFPKNLKSIGAEAFKNCGETYTDWSRYGDDNVGGLKGTAYYILPEDITTIKPSGSGWNPAEICSDDIEEFYKLREGYFAVGSLWSKKPSADDDPENYKRYVKIVIKTGEKNGVKIHKQFFTGLSSVDLSNVKGLTIGNGAFNGCVNLSEAHLPNDLTVLPNEIFANCACDLRTSLNSKYSSLKSTKSWIDWYHGLTTVSMSDNVTTIGTKSFQNCYQLKLKNKLPKKLVTIGEAAFQNCECIGDITMPTSVESILKNAFSGCGRIVDSQLVENRGLTSCDMRSSSKIKFIGTYAFENCTFDQFLMNSEAPISQISSGAFYNCQFVETISLSNSVEYVGSKAFSVCGRLEKIDITDACTLDKDICYGIKGSIGDKRFDDLKYSKIYNQSTSVTKWYVTTNNFTISIRILKKELTARQNQPFILPLKTAIYDGNNMVEEIKVGDDIVTFGKDGLPTTAIGNIPLIPSVTKSEHSFVDAYSQSTVKKDLKSGSVIGEMASENNIVDITLYMYFEIDSDIGNILAVSSALYSVDVTANPCKAINTNANEYLDYSSTKGMTITPEFVPTYSDSGITDLIEWNLKSGDEYITMTPSTDGKSAKILTKNNGFGTAVLTVKAGSVTKEITIQIVAPITGLSLSQKTMNMIVSGSDTLVVTPSYPSSAAEFKDEYPDHVTFTSSNPDVAKVSNVEVVDGKPQCKITAVGFGTADIIVRSQAGQKETKCTVHVSSKNLKLNFNYLEDGSSVAPDSTIKLFGSNTKTLSYSFSETVNSTDVSYEFSDSSVAKAYVSISKKTIIFTALKSGTTKVTIYPTVGNKTDNGTTFTISTFGEVKYITLSKKTISLGNTDSVFSAIKNSYGEEIKNASDLDFKSITDNEIKFESSSPQYVSVDNYGNVTVNKLSADLAPVIITCTATKNGNVVKSASTTVTPAKPKVKDITYTGTTAIAVGKTGLIQFKTSPFDVEYKSASISTSNGNYTLYTYDFDEKNLQLKINTKKKGSAVFTLTIKNNDGTKVTKDVKVSIGNYKINSLKTIGRVTQKKPKAGKKKVTIKWKKLKGAAGYQVQMSKKKKKGFKNIATINSGSRTKFIKKKLKRKKKYFFRVRAFVYNGSIKTYGKWSKVKNAKVK